MQEPVVAAVVRPVGAAGDEPPARAAGGDVPEPRRDQRDTPLPAPSSSTVALILGEPINVTAGLPAP